MQATRLAAVNPSQHSPPKLLQLAWLCEKWGAGEMLGPGDHFRTLIKMGQLMTIHRVFEKSARPPTGRGGKSGAQLLTPAERRIIRDVMTIIAEGDG